MTALVLDPVAITATSAKETRLPLDRRAWRVTVAGAELPPEVDLDFEVSKSRKERRLNSCSLSIFNLSPDSRAFLEGISLDVKANKKGTGKGSFKQVGLQTGKIRVEIEAGYEGVGTSLIFRGDLRRCWSERDSPDIVTKIWGEDGGRSALVSRAAGSFPPGTPVANVARYCAARAGVGEGNLVAALDGLLPGTVAAGVYEEGTVLSGGALDELRRILRPSGVSFSIQDGVLQCLGRDGYIPSSTVVLSAATGLIGSPVKDQNGYVTATALIQPGLFVGGRVRFDSRDLQGDCRILGVEYAGSTYGQDWYAKLECR